MKIKIFKRQNLEILHFSYTFTDGTIDYNTSVSVARGDVLLQDPPLLTSDQIFTPLSFFSFLFSAYL